MEETESPCLHSSLNLTTLTGTHRSSLASLTHPDPRHTAKLQLQALKLNFELGLALQYNWAYIVLQSLGSCF